MLNIIITCKLVIGCRCLLLHTSKSWFDFWSDFTTLWFEVRKSPR